MDANTHSPLRALETSWSGNGVYLFNVSSTDQILTNMDHHNHKRASLYPTIDLTQAYRREGNRETQNIYWEQ